MKKPLTKLFSFLTLSVMLISSNSYAKVKLPAIVSSNMVLQRSATISLWGWADAQEKIVITAS